jgi:hypothetical protein
VPVKIIYQQEYDTSSWVYKKYDPNADTYTDMSDDVTFGTESIGGKVLTTVSYTLIDGGQYDQDGTENGTIVDPAGPAVLSDSTLAETGVNSLSNLIAGLIVISITTYTWSRPRRVQYKLTH